MTVANVGDTWPHLGGEAFLGKIQAHAKPGLPSTGFQGCVHAGFPLRQPRKEFLKVFSWWACFSCSNVMTLQWRRGQWKARPPRAVLGKNQQHLDGLQCHFTTGGIFSVLSLQNKNKSRDPGRPLSHSLSPICQSGCRRAIYPSSVCKLGILGRGGRNLLPLALVFLGEGLDYSRSGLGVGCYTPRGLMMYCLLGQRTWRKVV